LKRYLNLRRRRASLDRIFTPVFHRSASDHHVMKMVELGSEPASAIFRK
jgi:hypothetical protein